MVSKTLVCLVLVALVASCYCKPTQDRKRSQQQQQQKPCVGVSEENKNSDESSQQPCDLMLNQQQTYRHQNNKGNTRGQNAESQENLRKVKVLMSQEDVKSIEIFEAPKHQPIYQGNRKTQNGQIRENVQNSRRHNSEQDSNENTSQVGLNQIGRY